MTWNQPDISGCQQNFLVVWRWNQLWTFYGILEDNFTDFQEAVRLEKTFDIVQENTQKWSKLISFLENKKWRLNQNVRHDYATIQQGVLMHFWVIFNTKMRPKYEEIILLSSSKAFIVVYLHGKQYCCPSLELFCCLPPPTPMENLEKTTNCNKLK